MHFALYTLHYKLMTTLTETAYFTRNAIKFGSIGLVLLLVIRVIWGIFSAWWVKANPPPPPPPTVSFGKLPVLNFPAKNDLPKITYKLETIEGTVPKLDSVGAVYTSVIPEAKFLSLEKIKATAARMGFTLEPQALENQKYRFVSPNSPSTVLDIDKISGDFRLVFDFTGDSTVLSEKKLPNNDQAIAEAKSFLQGAGVYEKDIETGTGTVSYLKYQAPDIVPAISLSEADFVKVALYRENLNNLKIVEENPLSPYISVVISGNRSREKHLIETNYHYNQIDREKSATYPLKNSSTAWQELQSGKGFIASLGENQDGMITIRRISLAYYDSRQPQNFIQPIFVFEGDRNFFAYVSAIDPKWVE